MRLTIATREATRFACLRFHYAHAVPVNPLSFAVWNEKGEWCGCILFGLGATPNICVPFGLNNGEVLELTRVALNGEQEATSQCVAAALKEVKKHCPLVRLIVSYADADKSHLGTIYQATNWIYCGEMGEGSRGAFIVHGVKMHPKSVWSTRVKIGGKMVHCPQTIEAVRKYLDPDATEFVTRGKRKYLYPLDRRIRKRILPLAKPYPKNEDWTPIDYKAQRAAKKAAKQKDTPPQ